MKFKIYSIYDAAEPPEKPYEFAYSETIHKTETFIPENYPGYSYYAEIVWRENGENIRQDEDGQLKRDVTIVKWFIDIYTLDELIKLVNDAGDITIHDNGECLEIGINDGR